MNLDVLRQVIEEKTGVPAALLNGETVEENLAQAKSLLAYRREHEAEPVRSTKEQFEEWFSGQDPKDHASKALADIASLAEDGKEDTRSTAEQFGEWLQGRMS